MKQHALSAIFPPLPDDEFAALVEDIKASGLRNPIVLFEGQVLDGWNRYRACLKARVNPLTTTYRGADPVSYVRAQNLLHRHLSASQRAAAVVALNDWRAPGRPASNGLNSPFKTNAEMAAEAGVGTTQIKAAKAVQESGGAELKQAVRDGEIPVQRGAEIAKLPKAEQHKAIKESGAAEKPKAPETVSLDIHESLKAELAEKDELINDLRFELNDLNEIQKGDHAKQMFILRASLKDANRARDDAMNDANQKDKQCKFYLKELTKLGWKKK